MNTLSMKKKLNLGHSSTTKETISILKKEIPVSYIVFFLLIIGVFVRIWHLGIVPGGINQDEAFSGYEAYSLLHYGIDSSGYSFPVYLITWGSGMNALNSYLMIPFMALFGAHTWVVRLPQVLVACFSLLVFYKLLKKIVHTKAALVGLFLLTICPWHIMMARWGLESNLAPGFLLFGLYFFVLGIEKAKYFMLSALFYGLSLYCYATIWPIVPLIILLQTAYLVFTKKIHPSIDLLISALILIVFAMPLLCFLLVNNGYMEEIRTAFLSIPKMPAIRSSEISFSNIPENFKNLWTIIFNENDNLYWNSTSEYGLYHKGVLFFTIIGFAYCIKELIRSIRTHSFESSVFILIQFLTSVFLGCLINVNVNRINCIHLSILLLATLGLTNLLRLLKKDFPFVSFAVFIVYSILFLSFEKFYFNTYSENIGMMFQDGLEESVNYAMELSEQTGRETIYVSPEFIYSKVLFYSRLSAEEYTNTVEYSNYPSAYMNINSAGAFVFSFSTYSPDGIYIISADSSASYESAGYTVEQFKNTAVAYYN